MTILFKQNRYSFISFFLLSFTAIWSQTTYKEYDFISIKEGISKVGISTIIQDKNEFIWLGTDGMGLYRYDGIDYLNYKHDFNDPNSISSSLVYSTFLDKKDRLWIGTEEGLNLYDSDYDKFKKIPIHTNENKNGKTTSIRSIKEDTNGNLFIGTFESGLFKLNLKNFKVEKVFNLDVDENMPLTVFAIAIDKYGKTYIGTDSGLKVFDYKTNSIRNCLFRTKTGISSIKDPVRSLLFDTENNMWAGTNSKGLYKVSIIENDINKVYSIENFPISENYILSMILLPDGSLMCGAENNGLFHLSAKGSILHNYTHTKNNNNSIPSNSIWSLFIDNNKRIWMGHFNSGVAVYDKLYDKFKNFESIQNNDNSLQVGSVHGIIQDENHDIWVCMDGGGIDIINSSSNTFTHIGTNNIQDYKGLTSDHLITLFIDSKKNIWVGSWGKGLYFLKNGTKKFINYNSKNTQGKLKSNSILSIDEDSEGTIWIGTFSKGLHSFNPKTKRFVYHNSEQFSKNNITTSEVLKVLIDSKDNLWLGTNLGLFKINKLENGSFSVVSMTDKMGEQFNGHSSTNHILSLCEGLDHSSLWIGTRGAGLCKYNIETDEFIWYIKKGLKEKNINAIIESKPGEVWVSGNTGITRLDVKTNISTNFSVNDGLLSNDFNPNAVFMGSMGNLFFGNYKGVDYFNPDQVRLNSVPPSLYLTGLKIFNKKVLPDQGNSPVKKVISESDNITLNPEQLIFKIEYSAINFTRPEKNQYAYYLKGLEDSWNYVGKTRSATYTNLNPGNYTFKLKSANNDGVWNKKPLELSITILPHWWETYWAISIYVALFFSGLYFLNKIMQIRFKEKELIKIEREKRIQEEQINEQKLRFFINISHEFRTPLTLILNPLEDIIQSIKFDLPKIVKKKHQIIYKNANRLSRLIEELMDFRKLELNKAIVRAKEIDLVPFTANIVSYFEEEANTKGISLNIEATAKKLNIWADQSMLEKIIFNILSNAFKVTPNGGSITLSASLKNRLMILPLIDKNNPTKVFEISIKDTGFGLSKDQLNNIFERFYQVDKLNNSYYGGTGIGLEVVQNFVKLHKGKIEVKSKINIGTVFKIILPAGKTHFTEEQIISFNAVEYQIKKEKFIPPLLKEDTSNITGTDNMPLTLLIVEDNIELVNYLKSELSAKYKILIANNGKKGLEIVQKIIPDVIITDVIMPKMNGFDFCVQIKNDLRSSHIPILMLTTKTQTDDWVEGIKSGADAYISKPFNMRILKSTLVQLIKNRELIFNKYFSVISDTTDAKNAKTLDKEFIQKVLSYINENLKNPDLSVEILASELNLSRSQFYRKIKILTGKSASEFLRKIRLQKAKLYFEKGNSNVSEVCYLVGFSTPSYFTKCFKKEFGILPTEVKVI